MINQILYTILFILIFLGLIQFCELLYKKFNLQAEITRKLAHILSSIFSLSFLFLFQSYGYVLFLGIALSLLLYLGKRYNSFNSIDSVERKTSGSFLLPISISILFILSKVGENDLYFVLPILILGISDPLAGMMGNFSNKKIVFMKKEFDKTYLGSLVFFLSSFIIVIIVLSYYSYEVINLILISILISILATLTEFLSSKGFDNLFVPHVVLLILYIVERSLFW